MGIDAGTSGIKAVVMDETGKLWGQGYRECTVFTPKPNWAEQDPLDWWEACSAAAAQAVVASGKGDEILAIGFSGQMQGSVLLDKAGNPIGNCMIWLDQRAGLEAEELSNALDTEDLMKVTGGYCLPSYWAAKVRWLQRNRPELLDRTDQILYPKDYLRYCMTGEIAVEVSDASLSFLLDLRKRNWSETMFKAAKIPMELVPKRMLESQEIAGYLKEDVADTWGVTAGIPVVAGGGDQPVGGIGCGVVREGMVAATIGTSGVVFGCCKEPFADSKRRGMYSLCHSVPGAYSFLGCTLGAGGSFKWMGDTLFLDKKEQLAREGKDVYDYMTSLAASAPPGCEGLCFLPYLNGESTPYVDPNARGVFFGLSYRHTLDALCRSVMEGVTFSLRDIIEILRDANGLVVHQVRVMGGGAKSALWRQIQADIYNAEVVTMNMEEGPAAGAAILAAVGAGYFSSVQEGCDSVLKIRTVTEPIPEHVKQYDEYYQTYHRLYRDLKEAYFQQAETVSHWL